MVLRNGRQKKGKAEGRGEKRREEQEERREAKGPSIRYVNDCLEYSRRARRQQFGGVYFFAALAPDRLTFGSAGRGTVPL